MPSLEIITTGEEVLRGEITDTNAAWISARFNEQGFHISRRTTVGDRMEDLVSAFREAGARADVVVVNGGLGPTEDDMSAEAAAQALAESRALAPAWAEVLERRFKDGPDGVLQQNLKQAFLPASATILDNPIGTACGFCIKLGKAWVYFTPGVPPEMKRMVRDQILPDAKQRLGLHSVFEIHRFHVFGIAEAKLGAMLENLELDRGVHLGFRAHFPTLEVKIFSLGDGASGGTRHAVQTVAAVVRERVGDFVVAENEASMQTVLQAQMLARGYQLVLAESCTGGMVASQLVAVPGSSGYLNRGFVTYCNEAKMEDIGVPAETLIHHGAVSLETAMAMAKGARDRCGVSHALSITGIAGPDGGSEVKPVGSVAFGLATPNGSFGQFLHLANWGRARIRSGAAAIAQDMLRRHLFDLPLFPDYSYAKRVAQISTS